MQHNILNWRTNKNSLLTNYLKVALEIILINSHGLKFNEPMKISGYKTLKINYNDRKDDCSAVAVK